MTHPENTTNTTLAQEFAAALEWWREAGVDHDFADDATEWLAEEDAAAAAPDVPARPAKAAAKIAPPPPPKKIGGEKDRWPTDLDTFQDWLVTDSDIDDGGAFPPVPPTGAVGAELMIVVPEPEENDTKQLLSGPQGRLLTAILQATGADQDKIYLASALRRHTPMPDWPSLQTAGVGDLLIHHIGLVAPKRVLSFGRSIPPLLGHDAAQGSAILHEINHDGRKIPVMGASSLAELLRSAGRRQRFWHRWLEWTDG